MYRYSGAPMEAWLIVRFNTSTTCSLVVSEATALRIPSQLEDIGSKLQDGCRVWSLEANYKTSPS